MEAAPKSAHAILAEAVDRLFAIMASALPMEESVDDAMGQLELARKNYHLAEKAAAATPFGSVTATALAALDRGDIEGARKCLNVLALAGDYVPLVDLSSITAPAA
jgi:hypothetical protein